MGEGWRTWVGIRVGSHSVWALDSHHDEKEGEEEGIKEVHGGLMVVC